MNEMFQFLLNRGGPVLFTIVFVEQLGIPLPAAPWLLAAGALAANGKLNPVLAVAFAVLACVLADWIWFFVGRRGGSRVLRFFCRMSLAQNSCVGRSKGLFSRFGLPALVLAKFLPGLGAVMPPLAGALGVGTGRFLFYDGTGALFYGSFYILAGFLFRDQLEHAMRVLQRLGCSAPLLALLVISAYVVFKFMRRNSRLGKRGTRMHSVPQLSVATMENTPAGARTFLSAATTGAATAAEFLPSPAAFETAADNDIDVPTMEEQSSAALVTANQSEF